MDENNFVMFGDCILIKPIVKKTENKTKLIRQNETDTSCSHFGEVVSISLEITEANFSVGSIVVFDVYSAEKFIFDNVEYYIAHTKDIFATIKED